MQKVLKLVFPCALVAVLAIGWMAINAEPAQALGYCPAMACISTNGYFYAGQCNLMRYGDLYAQCEKWSCPATSSCYKNCGPPI